MRVGIIGCGQLARMMALAGIPMGLKFSFVADHGEDTDISCVEGLGTIVSWQPGQSIDQLYNELQKPNVITVEKEQVDLNLLQGLKQCCEIRPAVDAIAICKHRYNEKQLLSKLDIPHAAYTYNAPPEDSAKTLGLPFVIKSVDQGYDGKNQWLIKTQSDIDSFNQLGDIGSYIAEEWIPFEKEVSIIAVRSASQEILYYPLTENAHQNGILVRSIAPAKQLKPELVEAAQSYIRRIMENENYIGVLAMECFVNDGKIIVNELAPRVHNSGHWTQSGSLTCQFENHLRAISGLVLGSVESLGFSGMINLLGTKEAPIGSITGRSKLHWYNKSSRPGRKLGHINFLESRELDLEEEMSKFDHLTPE